MGCNYSLCENNNDKSNFSIIIDNLDKQISKNSKVIGPIIVENPDMSENQVNVSQKIMSEERKLKNFKNNIHESSIDVSNDSKKDCTKFINSMKSMENIFK